VDRTGEGLDAEAIVEKDDFRLRDEDADDADDAQGTVSGSKDSGRGVGRFAALLACGQIARRFDRVMARGLQETGL